MESHDTLPLLKELIQDPELAEEAIVALSSTGSEGIPLNRYFSNSRRTRRSGAAAAKGLGKLALIPETLQSPRQCLVMWLKIAPPQIIFWISISVLTEVVEFR
ncbi:MAG: hypothetical protein R3B95_04605 [Nitrospirales bacterium]|nr:hypothetical protein [Nitrospirales bacterium]